MLVAILSLQFLSQSCSHGSGQQQPTEFPTVKIPSYINDGQLAIDYMAANYWNLFFKQERPHTPVASAVYGVDSLSFEKAFGMYAKLLSMSGFKTVEKSVGKLFVNLDSLAQRGDRKPLLKVISLMEHYFYNPNSPVLDEEIYLVALNRIMSSNSLSELDKMQYVYQQRICSMNRAGTPAADFTFRELLPGGGFRERNLYDVKGEYILLFFNNPSCNSCADILQTIKDSPVKGLVEKGIVKVVAMYIDENLSTWEKDKEKYPDEWIYAHDPYLILRDNGIYGLRAIPSLYLLDQDKRVLFKDAPVGKIVSYLIGE